MTKALKTYRALQQQHEAIAEQLNQISEDPRFKEELEFLESLESLMKKYGYSAKQTADILLPKAYDISEPTRQVRKRPPKTYKNPHTGETVVTAGGNHNTLKKWRKEYPDLDLSEWLVN